MTALRRLVVVNFHACSLPVIVACSTGSDVHPTNVLML